MIWENRDTFRSEKILCSNLRTSTDQDLQYERNGGEKFEKNYVATVTNSINDLPFTNLPK